jgi:hypothetical protein
MPLLPNRKIRADGGHTRRSRRKRRRFRLFSGPLDLSPLWDWVRRILPILGGLAAAAVAVVLVALLLGVLFDEDSSTGWIFRITIREDAKTYVFCVFGGFVLLVFVLGFVTRGFVQECA